MNRFPSAAALPPAAPLQAERVVDATTGTTWGELAAYYASVSELMLTQLRERPVALVRAPTGIHGPRLTQAHAAAPQALRDVGLLAPGLDPGHPPLMEIRVAAGLQSAVQAGTVELHTWNSTVRAIRKPDRIVLRLDPGPRVGWQQLREAAASVRWALSELGLKSFLKTSGAAGLHVVMPLMPSRSSQFVEQFAQALVAHLIDAVPGRFAAASAAPLDPASGHRHANGSLALPASTDAEPGRAGKVLIDGRRNGWGATTACAWSVRARPGLGISVPVAWDELDRVTGGAHWTVRDAAERIAVGNRPWEHYAASRQGLAMAIKALGFDLQSPSGRPPAGHPGDSPMWMHDTPPAPETPPPPGPPPTPVTPDGDPIQPVTDPLTPGHPEPVREPPMTRPPAAL